MTTGEPDAVAGRPIKVTTDTLLAEASLESVSGELDATRAVTAIYTTHYRSLVRLAVLLVRDVATAEEVVQDSFITMHAAWRRLRDTEKALSYLRQSVVNRSRSVLRHRMVVDYADLSEAQIATAMGISRGAVKSHTARGVAALRVVLELET